MLKLGTQITDTHTGQVGTLTVMQIELNGSRYYYFQPRGTNPKDGWPVAGRWVVDSSVEGAIEIDDPVIPDVLGSSATDTASGIVGKIVSMRLHINGCFHVSLQSNIVLPDTGTVPEPYDVDIRRLEGEKIPVFNEAELAADRKNNPSPERFVKRL